jgi:hypothetical protein
MADNVTLPGTGSNVAADEIGSVKHQRVKIQHGADGSATDVSSASPLPVSDAGGTLSVDDGGGSLTVDGTVGVSGTVPVSDGSGSLTVDAPLGSPVGVRLSDGSSAIGTTAQRLHVDDGGGSLSVDDNGGSLTVDVGTALPAGTNAIGKLAANSGVDIGDVDVTSIGAGTNLIGDVGLGVRTSSGLSVFRSIDLDESEEEVKGSAGRVYGYYFANLAASTRYLKFYNGTAAAVTVGTTAPFMTLPLPAGGCGHVPWPHGIPFSSAITVAATTGLADNDTGAPGGNEVVLNVFYA